MKYKALFVDLDGTILNTLKDIAIAVNFSLKQHNLPTKDDETIRTYLGKGSKYLIQCAIGNNNDPVLFKSVFDVYKQYYLDNPAVYTKPYDGAIDILKEFKNQGGKIALISNKPQDIAILLINKFFPNIFDVIYGQMDNVKTKPDPESINLAKEDLDVRSNEILYVGDSLVDLATAKNSNLDCILCNYGFSTKEEIVATKQTYIDDIKELRRYF